MNRTKTDQRVSVERIAQEIERNIQAHDEAKPDWQEMDLKVLIAELEGEVQELLQELYRSPWKISAIVHECADIAAYAMMIADKVAKWSTDRGRADAQVPQPQQRERTSA